ncbi:hypothetical protein ACIA8K_09560 [Catenuloplanes sp. NPDC051500]|uniref:hypothetical protein n=1 Tax=Catenuloplanes sp. NPDC051500 TaxID=3363959 RepID=UPI00379F8606
MLVRRWVARALMAATAGLIGAVTLGAAPAYADEVDLNAPGSFTAGSGPQNVDLRMRREDDGCVRARAQLRIQADDLSPDQVAVGVSSGGKVVQVQLQADGDGSFVTQLVQPSNAEMCDRRNRQQTVQFKVAFGPNAPNNELKFTGFMFDEQGNRLAEEQDGSRIRGGQAAPSPTPSRTPSKSPSPSPSPEESEEEKEPIPETTFASLPPDNTGPISLSANDGPFNGLGVPIAIGVVMVGVGAALIVLLIRRNRDETGGPTPAGAFGGPPPPSGGGGGGSLYRPTTGGGWTGSASATQMLPAQPPADRGPGPIDTPTQRYPGVPSGPNANRPPRTPPDPTTRMPRVTE